MLSLFDTGALFGLEQYSREYAKVGTFERPHLTGYLSACCDGSQFTAGMLHGLALGGKAHRQHMDRTLELRYELRR